LFATLDGLFLVESRYALINIYLVFFGLLGQWFFLLALEHQGRWRWFWLALSGIGFGACISVKWNGLGFLLGIYLIWILAWVMQWIGTDIKNSRLPLQNLTQIKLYHLLANLAILPAIIYYLVWIPHLQINTKAGFWELHKQILGFHQGLGSGASIHPYCSSWYTWPLMLRPMSYFYETARNTTEPIPSFGPPLPAGAGQVIYDIHAMGNPFLWWFSTAAIILLVIELAGRIWLLGNWHNSEHSPGDTDPWISRISRIFRSQVQPGISRSQVQPGISRSQVQPGISRSQVQPGNDFLEAPPQQVPSTKWEIKQSPKLWIALYLLVNYSANFLPWIKVTRCTFIYLYMPAAIFGFLILAWLVERWLFSADIEFRLLGVTVIFLVVLAFVLWMPVYLGLPLSSAYFKWRMWLRSWY
jgi:dolichyl-phosphate-mannose-protein mannosyltransferase